MELCGKMDLRFHLAGVPKSRKERELMPKGLCFPPLLVLIHLVPYTHP